MSIERTIAAVLVVTAIGAYFAQSSAQTVTVQNGPGASKFITVHNSDSYKIGKGEGFVQSIGVDMTARGGSETDVTVTINGEKVN